MNKKWFLGISLVIILLTGCKDRTYTVRIINDTGEVMSSVIINEGDTIGSKHILVPEKEGYIFVSWMSDGEYIDEDDPVYRDMDILASYTVKPEVNKDKATIIYDFIDYKKEQTVQIGDKAVRPDPPKKSGYIFLGWYYGDKLFDFDMDILEDITLVAKYQKEKVCVKFLLDNGDDDIVVTVNYGGKVDKPSEQTRNGYTFIGWYKDDVEYDFSRKVYEDIEIRAKWENIQYVEVVFDTDGGNEIESIQLVKGEKLGEIVSPKKDGYMFIGWIYNGRVFNQDMVINDNITLKANWKKKDVE